MVPDESMPGEDVDAAETIKAVSAWVQQRLAIFESPLEHVVETSTSEGVETAAKVAKDAQEMVADAPEKASEVEADS